MRYDRLYPIKVFVTGLSIPSLFLSLAPTSTGIKASARITANDFSPFFIYLFSNLFLLFPAFIIFSITFLLVRKRSSDFKKAKQILIAVATISILTYSVFISISSGEMLDRETMLLTLIYLIPIISCAAYYKIGYNDHT